MQHRSSLLSAPAHLRRVAVTAAVALLASGLSVPLAPAAHAAGTTAVDYTQYVDPFISTEDDFGQDGPGAFVPHGLAKLTPLSNPRSHTGYDYNSTTIKGFTAITLDGVGGNGAGGDFLVSPTYQNYTARPSSGSYDKTYSHANESAEPGYYKVGLTESGKTINAQVTADTRTGVQDYSFGTAGRGSLVVDLANNFGTRQGASLTVGATDDGRATLSGSLKGYFYNSSYTLYYYAETTVPTATVSTWGSTGFSTSKLSQSGTDIGAVLGFNVTAGGHVGLKVTLSPISVQQAKRDQQAEVAGKSFDDVRAAATAEWNRTLGAVEVEEGTDDDPTGDLKTLFYTHLFRMSGSPLNATSTDGTYRGADGKLYQAEGYTHYDSWSLWDDFHKYSSIAAVYPDVYRDVAQSLVDLFAEMTNSGSGSLGSLMQSVPTVRWERAAIVIADAINKGVDLKRLDDAYPSLVKHSNGNYSSANEALGFISGSVADTVGTSYDDWGMYVIASKLGKQADAARFLKRSTNYVNLFNKAALTSNAPAIASGTGVENVGLLMPKTSTGWTANVDPERFEASGAGLYQGTLWQYNWYDAQDMGGMIALMGGKESAKTALSFLFGEQAPDDCKRMLHSNANEIDLQSPYLFNYVGAPSRTQYWARNIIAAQSCNRYIATGSTGEAPSGNGEFTTPAKMLTYKNSPQGFLPTMDNDAATMSSVFVSGALGLFPVTAGSDSFQIGSPIFEKTTIHYPGGKDFVIEAGGVNADSYYIQDATLNGKGLDRTWLTYDELVSGGVLHFDMGASASHWGEDSPMAYTMSDELPSSVYDKTSPLVTSASVFEEAAANDGSVAGTVSVSGSGVAFAGEAGADLTSQVSATGLPDGLSLVAGKAADGTLALSLAGKATHHLVDDSTDGVTVTLAEGAFEGTAPALEDRTLSFKIRFTGYSLTPSTTTVTAGADGTVDATVDLTLAGGVTFAGPVGAGLPSDAVSFPGLDEGITGAITKTGPTTARLSLSGTLASAQASTFILTLKDAALHGASAAQVSGPGMTGIDPFRVSPLSNVRADLQALYDDARLVTSDNYSGGSFGALQTALTAAAAALADDQATDTVLNRALVNLQAAIDGLVIGEGAYRLIQAEAYDVWSGGSLKTESGGTGTNVGGVSPGSWLGYRGLDFSEKQLDSFLISYSHNPSSASASAKLELRTGSATGPLVTTIDLPTTNGWSNYTQLTHKFTDTELQALSGRNDVYLVFLGSADKAWVANPDYFQFLPVASQDPGSFQYLQLTPTNVTQLGPNVGRDSLNGVYTNFGNTHNEEWVKFAGVQFGPHGADTLSLSYDKPNTDRSTDKTWIEVRLGSSTGTTVAATPMLARTGASGWGTYVTLSISVDPKVFTGTQDVFFVFRMDPPNTTQSNPYVANVKWFQFGDSTAVGGTQKTVQFESIRSGNGLLSAAGLVSGTDYSGADLKVEVSGANSSITQLAGTKNGSWVRYQNVNLGDNLATSLSVTYDAPGDKAVEPKLAVYLDSMAGDPLLVKALPNTAATGWGTFQTVTMQLPQPITGNHALYFQFQSSPTGTAPYAGNFDSFTLGYGADKAALNAEVTGVADLAGHADRYLAADFAVFTRALDAAREVLADPAATGAEVTSALRTLKLAADQLQWKVVKQLDDLIVKAKAVDERHVTPESYATLTEALGTATSLNEQTSSYEDYQAALAGLNVAYSGLSGVDRTALAEVLVTAGGLSADTYTTSSWAALTETVQAAQAVADDQDATQAQVNESASDVSDAIASLVTKGDPTSLQALVDAGAVVSGKLDGFTAASAKTFTDALAAARQTLAAADDRSQAQLDAAASSLQAALAGLTVKPAVPVDKAVLQSIYASASALSNKDGIYTTASWNALQAQLANARAVLKSSSATQSQVDAAVRGLAGAVAGLRITAPLPVKVKFNQSQLRLVKGTSFILEEGVYYSRGSAPAYAGAVTWKSSNTKVATVSSAGKIKAKKPGTVTITATTTQAAASGKKLSVSIEVSVVKKKPKAKVTKVTASVPRTLKLGQTFSITGKYSSSKATGVKVTYATSRADIVVIDKVGRMVATTKGTEYVLVTAAGVTTKYKITVS